MKGHRNMKKIVVLNQKSYMDYDEVLDSRAEEIIDAMNDNVAAVMVELIQGESGVRPLTPEYVNVVRELCDKYGVKYKDNL